MAIIRHKSNSNFSVINNEVLRDKNLSWKAKGLFAYLMTLPNDWKIHIREVVKHSSTGEKATYNAMNELIKNKYAKRIWKKKSGKFKSCDYHIYDKKVTVSPF